MISIHGKSDYEHKLAHEIMCKNLIKIFVDVAVLLRENKYSKK